MSIRWSALKVNEATVTIEGFLDQAVEPLEQARLAAQAARKIDNLPQYIEQGFTRIIGEIDRTIGGSQYEPDGLIRSGIQSVRSNIPSGSVEADQADQKHGSQQSLV